MPSLQTDGPCGATLAFSYFKGYLDKLMTGINQELLKEFSNYHDIPYLHNKLIILLPRNCYNASNIVSYDVTSINKVGRIRVHKDVSGMTKRPYDVDVLSVTHNQTTVYAMFSMPASLITIYEMCVDLNMDKIEASYDKFYEMLQELIYSKWEDKVQIIPIKGTVPDFDIAKDIHEAVFAPSVHG